MKRICCLFLYAMCTVPNIAHARCRAVTPREQQRIIAYVSERFNIPAQRIEITDDAQLNSQCYRTLQFADKADRSSSLTLVLSPDRRYLLPLLFDLNVSPRQQDAKDAAAIKTELRSAGPIRGAGSIQVVEFGDFQCPFCKRFADMLARQTNKTANDLSFTVTFVNFPLPTHSWAETAARIGICLSEQSDAAFWEFHDYLYNRQATIDAAVLSDIAETIIRKDALTVDLPACIKTRETDVRLAEDLRLAKKLNVTATPTIFIDGRRYVGVLSDQQFARALGQEHESASTLNK